MTPAVMTLLALSSLGLLYQIFSIYQARGLVDLESIDAPDPPP